MKTLPERAKTMNQAERESALFAVVLVQLPRRSEIANRRRRLRTPGVNARLPIHGTHDAIFPDGWQIVPHHFRILGILRVVPVVRKGQAHRKL